ncbi:MAG: hypothetical protein PVI76_04780, partial [Desulfobacterales bacterium]
GEAYFMYAAAGNPRRTQSSVKKGHLWMDTTEFILAAAKRTDMHPQSRCGTVFTTDPPFPGFQDPQDIFALHFLNILLYGGHFQSNTTPKRGG